MRIVSYVTEEYRRKGERLADCLSKYKVPFHVEFMPSFGTSKDHKIYKPFFLEKMFEKFPNDPDITLVDGDSFFVGHPLDIPIKADMGLVLGKQHLNHQHWFSDAYHTHRPTAGTKEFIRVWKKLCEDRDWVAGNNHPRIIAAFYLTMKITTFEYLDLKGTFVRNYGKKGAMVY